MTIFPLPLIDVSGVATTWPDDVVDLTDRRRLLVLAVLGVDVPPPVVDAVFRPGPGPSWPTCRTGRQAPDTDAT